MTEDAKFSHLDAEGRAHMVDIATKDVTQRHAVAESTLRMQTATAAAIQEGRVKKGAVLGTARIAGIMAAKRTSDLIPLCHPLALTSVTVDFEFTGDGELHIKAAVGTTGKTGVEMEALMAASVAALTIYDMCKALDRAMVISDTQLVHKSGGKSGTFDRGS
ncbi:MAG: cyclic pyranopterin monophosphate synthase MoaC [Planctomycetota bacterium]